MVESAPAALNERDVHRIVADTLGIEVRSWRALAEGAFGLVYEVMLDRPPGTVVLKMQRFPGFGEIERRRLEILRRYAPVPVPEVYGLAAATDGTPEVMVMVMQRMTGVEGRRLGSLDDTQRDRVGDAMIDALIGLQSHVHAEGYGDLNGPPVSWPEFYEMRVDAIYRELKGRQGADNTLPDGVIPVMDRARAAVPDILRDRDPGAVLVHGDFCLGNLLFNPESFEIEGLIDPLDSCWGDPEFDLVHLTKSNGHLFRLVERYRERRPSDDGFDLRYWTYMFWTWLSYNASINLREDVWYARCAERLTAQMDRYGVR